MFVAFFFFFLGGGGVALVSRLCVVEVRIGMPLTTTL